MPSWTEAGGGVGWINGRRFRQAKVMRPRFSAGSIRLAGNKTWASARFDCMISSRRPSGQCSASAFSGAEMTAVSVGAVAASAGAGAARDGTGVVTRGTGATGGATGTTGGGTGTAATGAGAAGGGTGAAGGGAGAKAFAAPLLRGVARSDTNNEVVSCDMGDSGGAAPPGAGVIARGTNAGGGGATGVG